ncbi:MAG: type II toxin-antitoxin system VapC family toxin [Beijerinckiaceae bacterium]
MTPTLVVDAGVALKLLLPEPLGEYAYRLAAMSSPMIAPNLIRIEIANAFWKSVRKGVIDPNVSQVLLARVRAHFAELVDEDTLLPDALHLATTLNHPVYDCIYLALAETRSARLVTANERLMARIKGTEYARLVTPLSEFAA